MLWAIVVILIAASIIYIAWKIIKTILYVAVIAIVLVVGVILFGFHEIHLSEGVTRHGQSVLTSVDHSANAFANRILHGLEKGHHS